MNINEVLLNNNNQLQPYSKFAVNKLYWKSNVLSVVIMKMLNIHGILWNANDLSAVEIAHWHA